jgi:signal transduction histidine kinase
MKELVDDVLFALHSTLKKLPIEVKVLCAERLQLTGMPGILQQLFTNLVMNAIQHAFDGGVQPGMIEIALTRLGNNVHLEFSDNGKGMGAAHLARIFEPFYTTRRGEGGSGLGLYICYNIVVTQLGGTIECLSQPGQGCRFVIEFPITLKGKQEKVSP